MARKNGTPPGYLTRIDRLLNKLRAVWLKIIDLELLQNMIHCLPDRLAVERELLREKSKVTGRQVKKPVDNS